MYKRYIDVNLFTKIVGGALKEVATAPEADVVEVVRCKDCRFRDTTESNVCVFYDAHWTNYDDDFCQFGERRTP